MTVTNLLTPATIRSARPGEKEYTLRDAQVSGFGLRVMPSGAKSWVLRMGTRRITIGVADQIDLAAARAQASKLVAAEAPPPLPPHGPLPDLRCSGRSVPCCEGRRLHARDTGRPRHWPPAVSISTPSFAWPSASARCCA